MRTISKSISQTHKLAEGLAKKILKNQENRHRMSVNAVVVALQGDLGAGKTTFTQGFAKALGIKEKITSPTFTIMKNYKPQTTNYKLMAHIDSYRLEGEKDLLELGWKELIEDPKNIILIEWPEKVKKTLPKNTIWIKFGHKSEKERVVDICFK